MKGSNKTDDFLAEIYRGAKMGTETIGTVLPKVNDTSLRDELQREQSEYQQFEAKALQEISRRQETPQDISKMQQMGAWMGIQMNTVIDSTASHIADLMIQGNNMGVIGITKSMNAHPDAEQPIKSLAQDFIRFQEKNIDALKPFLK